MMNNDYGNIYDNDDNDFINKNEKYRTNGHTKYVNVAENDNPDGMNDNDTEW